MKVRRLSTDNDMTFGNGGLNFIGDSAEAVAQNIYTRLKLWLGEWFLDTNDGTDWLGKCLGKNTLDSAVAEIRRVILNTDGVEGIVDLTVSNDTASRQVKIQATVKTPYGETLVSLTNKFTIGE